MSNVVLEFTDVRMENVGHLDRGRMKLTEQSAVFYNNKTGATETISAKDIESCHWSRLGNGPALRFLAQNGKMYRFGGFDEADHEKLKTFFKANWHLNLETKNICCKGVNYGALKFLGSNLEFEHEDQLIFDIPLNNVSNCLAAKNELTLEFHQNDECPVSLMEIRFHVPSDATEDDPAEEYKKKIVSKAGVIQETGKALAVLEQILCATPRGRYDIKIYPSFLALHGKTFNYNIPISSILGLFLLPHQDGRRMFFVIGLDPPIKQGQTRYNFLILELPKDEEVELELGLPEDVLKEKYGGQLTRCLSGSLYEVLARIMKAIVRKRIRIPGRFTGNTGTPAISCAYKSASGFLYPMEKGFMFIHKPPLHIRFEDVASVHFDRSDVITRSFDFEVTVKSGMSYTFTSIEKEENAKLYEYVNEKRLHIVNVKKPVSDVSNDLFEGNSDGERDHYAEQLKNEAREMENDSSDSADSDYDPYRKDEKPPRSGSSTSSKSEEESDEEKESSGTESDAEESDKEKRSPSPHRPAKRELSSSDEEKKMPPKKMTKKVRQSAGADRSGRKRQKDGNAPKKPQSAYVLWMRANRDKIKEEGMSFAEIGKKAGELWKNVTDKKKWEELARKDRVRYQEEMSKYEEAQGSGLPKTKQPTMSKSAKVESKVIIDVQDSDS
ncbi:FACT complex subunit SSRP1 [Trichuris trichiura]|uniref:FACT complex subunit SSRP1 n=1 Tax=Trichuris trichiura TaxID=36087 RepID=A0A077YW65_TRITR|nr:FACT complex subunit SSRP1 [Trichuris trichiura]